MSGIIIVIRNGKIVWNKVWVEYKLRSELEIPKILVPRLRQKTSNVNIECTRKQLNSFCDQPLAGALIYLYFIVLILICFNNMFPPLQEQLQ